MTVKEILLQLQSLSNEKMIAHNIKNGAGKNQYGVKLGDIRKLADQIKTNHQLALELWKTNNLDARLLACLLIKPKSLSKEELNELVESIDHVQVADWVNSYIVKEHPEKELLREMWMNADNKWAARAGWSLTSGKIAKGAEGLELEHLLDRIEKEMPGVRPEIQWTMNTALAYIGIYHQKLRKRAIEIGNKMGIYKDYPVSKGCTSPFAPIWINEMVSRKTVVKNANG
jgi:3-methyladenine DNA glycosylase AlkD